MLNKEQKELRKMSDEKLVQHYKDYRFEFESFGSVGRYENWYISLIEKEMERRGLN